MRKRIRFLSKGRNWQGNYIGTEVGRDVPVIFCHRVDVDLFRPQVLWAKSNEYDFTWEIRKVIWSNGGNC